MKSRITIDPDSGELIVPIPIELIEETDIDIDTPIVLYLGKSKKYGIVIVIGQS